MVVGVTSDDAAEVEPYLKKNDVKFPIAIAGAEDYGVRGIPDALLIDKDGKILWRGHPARLDNKTIEQALVGARPAIVMPGLEEVQVMRRAKDFGAAYRLAKAALDGGKLGEAAVAQATRWLREYEQQVTAAVATADSAETGKDVYAQWAALQPIADWYQGVPGADLVKQRLDKLMADGKNKREVEAGKKMAVVTTKDAAREYDAAYAICKELAMQFGQTKCGKEAAALMKAYEKDGKLGFDARCSYCQANGVACATHRKKKK